MPRLAPVTSAIVPAIFCVVMISIPSWWLPVRSSDVRVFFRSTHPGIAPRANQAGVTTATGLASGHGLLDHGRRACAARRGSAGRAQAGRPARRSGGARAARDRDGPARGAGTRTRAVATGGARLRPARDRRTGALLDRRGGRGARRARSGLADTGAERSPARVHRAWRSRERGPRPAPTDPAPVAARPRR